MPRKPIFSIVIAAVTLLMAGGCGGSGGGHHNGGGTVNQFAGNYFGNAPLQTGAVGDLQITVDDDGTSHGTLVVTVSGAPVPQSDGLPDGTYLFTGTTDNEGHFTGTGDASGTSFTIAGLFAIDNDGFFTISSGSSNWPITMQHSTTNSGGADITYSNAGTSNAHTDHFPIGNVSGFVDDSAELEIFIQVTDSDDRGIAFNMPKTLQVGDTYTFDASHHLSTYTEPDPTDSLFHNTWQADGGTITLTAKSGTHYTFTVDHVHYTAVVGFGHAEGSLVLNGTFHS